MSSADPPSPPPPPSPPSPPSPPPPPPPLQPPTTEASGGAEEPKGEPRKSPSPFIQPQPTREDQVQSAAKFLSHPKVRSSPASHRRAFLERKGLSRQEIDEAFQRVPESPSNEMINAMDSHEDHKMLYGPAKGHEPPNLVVFPSQQQPVVQQPVGLVPLSIVQEKRPWSWSVIVMAISLFAATSAGAAALLRKVLIPKFKAWVQRIIVEENDIKRANEMKAHADEDASALATAISAASSAAISATQVAEACQSITKSRNEEWQQLTNLAKALESNIQELTTAVFGMKSYLQNVTQPKELLNVPSSTPSFMDVQKAEMNGSGHTLSEIDPRKPWQPSQLQSNSNVLRRTSSTNMDSSPATEKVVKSTEARNQREVPVNQMVTETIAEPWWRRKKAGSTWSPETSTKVREVNSIAGGDFNLSGSSLWPSSSGSKGGANLANGNMNIKFANQRGISPDLPETSMPWTATTVRYTKVPGKDELQMLPSTEEISSTSPQGEEKPDEEAPWTVHEVSSLSEDDGHGRETLEHASEGIHPQESVLDATEVQDIL